jgi:ribosomal protein S18 acetylase RimI-like enzyme
LIVRITPFSQPADLDAILAARGLARFDDTRVMVLPQLTSASPGLPAGIEVEPIGLEQFARLVGGFRESPMAQREAHAQRLRQSPVPFFPFELREKGVVLGCGQFALEDDLAGLYDVFTLPSARGRGLARSLCTELLAEAAARGAKHAYLQVEGNNHAARAVYHRLGFADGYAYHYRTRDPSLA